MNLRNQTNVYSESWVHTPRYLLRRSMILRLLREYKPGRFLEIGCGRGELMPWLAQKGFEGVGLEIANRMLPIAERTIAPFHPKLNIVSNPLQLKGERFQYIFAFEVLEHIKNDEEMILQWREWLNPDGRFIFSVPARMKLWTPSDFAVGHFRRYERDSLKQMLKNVGFEVERFWSYGFPLRLLTRPIQYVRYRSQQSFDNRGKDDMQEKTLDSSLGSTFQVPRALLGIRSLTEAFSHAFHIMQLPFRQFDWGDGYLVACRQKS